MILLLQRDCRERNALFRWGRPDPRNAVRRQANYSECDGPQPTRRDFGLIGLGVAGLTGSTKESGPRLPSDRFLSRVDVEPSATPPLRRGSLARHKADMHQIRDLRSSLLRRP